MNLNIIVTEQDEIVVNEIGSNTNFEHEKQECQKCYQ